MSLFFSLFSSLNKSYSVFFFYLGMNRRKPKYIKTLVAWKKCPQLKRKINAIIFQKGWIELFLLVIIILTISIINSSIELSIHCLWHDQNDCYTRWCVWRMSKIHRGQHQLKCDCYVVIVQFHVWLNGWAGKIELNACKLTSLTLRFRNYGMVMKHLLDIMSKESNRSIFYVKWKCLVKRMQIHLAMDNDFQHDKKKFVLLTTTTFRYITCRKHQ